MNTFMNLFEELNKLYEADEVFADEAEDVTIETDDAAVEAEDTSAHRALVCAACGAISIVAAEDVEIDEESDLANVDVECEACNKAEGFKVIGDVTLYDGAMEDIAGGDDDDDDEEVEVIDDDEEVQEELATSQILTEGKFMDALKKAATRIGADAATIVRCFGELSNSEAAYDLTTYIENKAVLKALKSGNKSVLNTLTQDDIEDLAKDIAAYERDSAHRKATKDTDFLVLVSRHTWSDGKETYDAEAYATSKATLEKYRKEHMPYEKDEDIQIVSAKEAKKLTGSDITRSTEKYIEDVEEGLFDFGKKKREAERKRQEEEEAARKAEQEKSKKTKWPTAADYDAYEREQREKRRIDAQMAQYKAMGQGWNKRDDSSSPSNTPYVGVNYSGGDYF
jgi:hypothetical protein